MKNAPFLSQDSAVRADEGEDRLLTSVRWVLNIALVLLIVWLTWDWLVAIFKWWPQFFEKDLPKHLGIPAGVFGVLLFVAEQIRQLLHWKKKQEDKKSKPPTGEYASDLPDQSGEIVPR
jgi:hypothetical protein